jgi:DHA2 family multidrug resistance protein
VNILRQPINSVGIPKEAAYAQVQNMLTQQSLMMATSEIFWLCSLLFVCLMGVIWLTKPLFSSGGGDGH